jgi:hypothetical protein
MLSPVRLSTSMASAFAPTDDDFAVNLHLSKRSRWARDLAERHTAARPDARWNVDEKWRTTVAEGGPCPEWVLVRPVVQEPRAVERQHGALCFSNDRFAGEFTIGRDEQHPLDRLRRRAARLNYSFSAIASAPRFAMR